MKTNTKVTCIDDSPPTDKRIVDWTPLVRGSVYVISDVKECSFGIGVRVVGHNAGYGPKSVWLRAERFAEMGSGVVNSKKAVELK